MEPVLFAILTVSVVTDLLWRRVPNWLTLPALLLGFAFQIFMHGSAGALTSLAGAATGFLLLIGFYSLGGMGAGDVKLLTAVGAWIGATGVCAVFLVTGLFGGVYAAGLIVVPAVAHHGPRRALRRGVLAIRTVLLTGQVRTLMPDHGSSPKLRYAVCITGAVLFARLTEPGLQLVEKIGTFV